MDEHTPGLKRKLSDDTLRMMTTEGLYRLSYMCEVEPADPTICDACAAYLTAQEKKMRVPWENEDGSTNVDGFLAAYAEDNNDFWRADKGHIMNVLDEVLDRLENMEKMADAMEARSQWPVCGCSYDRREDVCLAHSPATAERDAVIEQLRAELAFANDCLNKATGYLADES
jgi:hypothetical protein